MAQEVLESPSPAEAKAVASRVPSHLHQNWHSIKLCVMKEILHAKAGYCDKFKEDLLNSGGKRLVESVREDIFWSAGLPPRITESTKHDNMPNMSTNINAPRHIMPLGTMVNCLYVHILGIILLCLWLHAVYFILCVSIAVMFLVCGDVSACISACRHASHKLRRTVIARISPSCSINNNNRVAKLSETLYLI